MSHFADFIHKFVWSSLGEAEADWLAVAALAFSCVPAVAAETDTFLSKAIQGDLTKLKMGELANKKSGSFDVRTFAQTLMTDHAGNKALASAVAKEEGVAPPQSPSQEDQQEYEKLAGLSGEQFNQKFINYMVEDHKKTIKEFEAEAKTAKDSKVAQYAKESLAALEKHLQMAEKLQESMNVKARAQP